MSENFALQEKLKFVQLIARLHAKKDAAKAKLLRRVQKNKKKQ